MMGFCGRWFRLAAIVALVAIAIGPGLHSPRHAAADTDLLIGGEAAIAYADGDQVRLRGSPGSDQEVVTSFPEGTTLTVLDGPVEASDGSFWYQVTDGTSTGYMVETYLALAAQETSEESAVVAAATMVTTDALNLRSGPSANNSILLVMPAGASVQTTGAMQNGFTQLTYQGTTGWAASQYLSSGGTSSGTTAIVVDGALNLRSGPSTSDSVVAVMPDGAEVTVTGAAQNGFYPVTYGNQSGWAFGEFLSFDGGGSGSGEIVETAATTSALNLRAGSSLSSAVLLVIPSGVSVGITGAAENGFYPAQYNGVDGWASGDFLDFEGSDPVEIIDTAVTTDSLNLRSGPGTGNSVRTVMPAGAEVGIIGAEQNGFYPVRFNDIDGWAAGQYLDFGSEAPVEPTPAWTTAVLNFRSGPNLTSSVLSVIPAGAEVTVTGAAQGGFYPIRYNSADGWVSGTYLTFDEPDDDGPGEVGGIVWPVSGGTWEITQGYNGFSHINGNGGWQYRYSFDIARADRNTAGVSVYSPVSGVVRWTERSSGGITIDRENGYAFAMFHLTVDRGWQPGDRINQGDYIGTVSGPGGEGFVDFAHIHLTAWETTDGGNWSRIAVPFTGVNAINGVDYPADGSYSQWNGTRFTP
jgi:uncharacterized protein YgiM (DUF1202 family)